MAPPHRSVKKELQRHCNRNLLQHPNPTNDQWLPRMVLPKQGYNWRAWEEGDDSHPKTHIQDGNVFRRTFIIQRPMCKSWTLFIQHPIFRVPKAQIPIHLPACEGVYLSSQRYFCWRETTQGDNISTIRGVKTWTTACRLNRGVAIPGVAILRLRAWSCVNDAIDAQRLTAWRASTTPKSWRSCFYTTRWHGDPRNRRSAERYAYSDSS